MPLLDHFHPPLHGPRRWEGFQHSWATFIAKQLNEILPQSYFAESEITVGLELDIDVAATESATGDEQVKKRSTDQWSPPRPKFTSSVSYEHFDETEIRA